MTEPIRIAYNAPPTLSRFLDDDSFVRCVVGPVGSGKSSACVLEILRRACEQRPGPNGKRCTKFAVIRNSYPQLRDTTRKTFEQWIPAELGRWRERDFIFEMRFNDVECDVLFRALDRPEDVKNLLSLELTGAYFNEMREVSKAIFDAMQARVSRYPAKKDGGPTWFGIWGDTNPWHARHWADTLFKLRLPGYGIYRQPGGRSAEAENLENLDPAYYTRLVAGKDSEWVKVYIDGEDAASALGSIWGEAIDALDHAGGITEFEHGNDGVFTSWDLGRSDSTAIWFWRIAGPGMVELIDHYEEHLKGLSHYFDVVEKRGYRYVKHWLPHDARAKTLASEVSVEDQCRARWPGQVQIGPALSLQDGIQAARWLLEGRCKFHSRTAAGIDALKSYRREWDEESRAYSTTPLHDWSSHTADAFRYCAVVAKVTELITSKPRPITRAAALPMNNSYRLDDIWDTAPTGGSEGGRL